MRFHRTLSCNFFLAHSIYNLFRQSHILTWFQLPSIKATLKFISPAQTPFLSLRSCFQMLACHRQLSVSQAPKCSMLKVSPSDFPRIGLPGPVSSKTHHLPSCPIKNLGVYHCLHSSTNSQVLLSRYSNYLNSTLISQSSQSCS